MRRLADGSRLFFLAALAHWLETFAPRPDGDPDGVASSTGGRGAVKVVILAGGLGTRLAEETDVRPKPMVEIGGKPILWHIMKHYARYGFNEFLVALGYKGVDQAVLLRLPRVHGDLIIDAAARARSSATQERRGLARAPDRHRARHMTGGRVKRLRRG